MTEICPDCLGAHGRYEVIPDGAYFGEKYWEVCTRCNPLTKEVSGKEESRMEEYRVVCFYGNNRIRDIILVAPNEEAAKQELKKLVLKQGTKESSILSLHATPMSVYEGE